ncbi:MAG: hypothetical protein IJA35_01590 [Clostridia bacterium]|nr:hypothetical protein [Clostridia bacterium]
MNNAKKWISMGIFFIAAILLTSLLKVEILADSGVVRNDGAPLGSFISLGFVAVLAAAAHLGPAYGALVGSLGIAVGTLFAGISIPGAGIYAIPNLIAAALMAFLIGQLLKKGSSWLNVLRACSFSCIIPIGILFLFDMLIMGDGILASCAFWLNIISMAVTAIISIPIVKLVIKNTDEGLF